MELIVGNAEIVQFEFLGAPEKTDSTLDLLMLVQKELQVLCC